MAGIRRDVAALGAGWNTTLEWYAKAFQAMWAKPLADRTGWKYLAGIHGFNQAGWIGSGIITNADALPPAGDAQVWDQCQHATWYFLPWHRGYLHAFEAIVGATVKRLGGPADWALPYWNYFSGDPAAMTLPTAFTAPTMPDGSPNPLAWPRTNVMLDPTRLNLNAMRERRFTAAPGTLGFGGGVTTFSHFNGGMTGAVEFNPHNEVHGRIGAFMGDPNYAALDPIFWLHHCNVDRLWAAWLRHPRNAMENRKAWRDGPARQFKMPAPDGRLHFFTPANTMPGKPLAPRYDDLNNGTGLAVPGGLQELAEGEPMPARLSSEEPPPAKLMGASKGKIVVNEAPATADVKLEKQATEAAGLQGEQRVFLNLENVKGEAPSASLTLRISAPGAGGAEKSSYTVPVTLFGLAKSSAADSEHGGNGINVVVDITEIAQKLADDAGASVEQLQVHIEQEDVGDGRSPVTVERISIYTQSAD
jgi:tyrosinase